MMPTRWPNYSLFLFAALFGLMLPFALSTVWRWFRGDSRAKESSEDLARAEAGTPVGEAAPIAIRFHLAALLFQGFFALALLLIPLLYVIRSERAIGAAVSVFAIVVPFVIVLFYCIRKGDLSWSAMRSRGEES